VVVGRELRCESQEPDNESDRYTLAVKKDGIMIDHLP